MPGTGKTYQLVNIEIKWAIDNGKKYVVLGYTCNSCQNIKCQCADANVMTFDKFFEQHQSVEKWIEKAKHFDIIFIEEFSMIPKRFIFILFQIKQRYPHIIYRIFGDHNQCAPMDKDWINYVDCPSFQYLVDYNSCTLQYKEGTSRYDRNLFDVLVFLLDTGKLHPSLHHKRLNDDIHMSMCLTGLTVGSATRTRINAEQRKKWTTESQTGMPVASTNNLKTLKIMNGQRFRIQSVTKQFVILKDEENKYQVPPADFSKKGNFTDGFCDSVFRYQGRTVREPYNIYDVKRMSLQDFYVVLSRFTTVDHIFFEARGLEDHVFVRQTPPALGQLLKVIVQPYRIYKITSVDEKTLQKRFKEHLDKPTSVEMARWMPLSEKKIELIEEITYMSLSDVKKLEAKYISAVPRHRSKNSQHRQREKSNVVDLTQRCNIAFPTKAKLLTAKYDAKRKRFKVQKKHNGKNITTTGKTAEEAEDKWRVKVAELEEEEYEDLRLADALATLE
jgi:hypothetical protein